jgi:Uma2 family endonuclease
LQRLARISSPRVAVWEDGRFPGNLIGEAILLGMGIPVPAKRRATYEDVLSTPEHMVAEIVDGELYTSPRPAPAHAHAARRLGAKLDPFDSGGSGGPGGWVILIEPELHLGGHVMVPDLAGWRRQRLPEMPDMATLELAPDWVCEILSPRTEAFDRSVKMPRYSGAGVEFAWLIDPGARLLEVYRHRDGTFHLESRLEGDGAVRAVPFNALDLDLGGLWRW